MDRSEPDSTQPTTQDKTPPCGSGVAYEPATVERCVEDYAAGKATRESFDEDARRYYR